MRLEILTEDEEDEIIEPERLKKTKFKSCYEENIKPTLLRRRFFPPEVFLPSRISNYLNLSPLLGVLSSEQQQLLERFILENGPKAVIHSVRADLEKIRTGTLTDITNYHLAMARATGAIFERVAYIWFKQQMPDDGDTLVLDPGSSRRISFPIRNVTRVPIHPDCAVFTDISQNPTLRAILEFKSAPENAFDQLQRQLQTMRHFADKYSGHNLKIPILADRQKRINFESFKVAEKLEYGVVVPDDKDFELADGTPVLKAPFPSGLVKLVAKRCVGYMEDHSLDLGLLKETNNRRPF